MLRFRAWPATILVASTALVTTLRAAGPVAGQGPASRPADNSTISLNLPDNVEIKTLLDYVSERLNINIIYQDELLANQKVTIRSPMKISPNDLMGLLRSLLKIKGLAIVDLDQPGFMKIVPMQAAATTRPQASGGDSVVTQVLSLATIDATRAETAVKPFLSGPAAGSVGIPEQHLLLVTDFASNLQRIEHVIELIDQPNKNLKVEFIPVKNADAASLTLQLKTIMAARSRVQTPGGQNVEGGIDVSQDRRSGQLVFVGTPAQAEEARAIVKALDVPVSPQQSPIRFYKLANATASDVLQTIQALEGDSTTSENKPPAAAPQAANAVQTASPAGFPSASSAGTPTAPGGFGGNAPNPGGGISALPQGPGTGAVPGPNANSLGVPGAIGVAQSSSPAPSGFKTKNASIAADPNTNTIIVLADPAVQTMYEQLIKSLDKRRPQVLIEATIISLDTSHGFTYGVELSGNSKPGKSQAVTFSSFGFSTPNPMTGALALLPGNGFNGAVIASDVADVIVRALATSSHAKVTSAPRILVNDNATGTLTSLDGEPYTTTAIGTTISTTSFGGYAQAGTTVTLTPHISESDYLQLEFQVSLSSFTTPGNPTQGIPPGIQQDAVQSKVTVPDGSTIIVGGLNRTNYMKTVQSIPFLDQIPILKYIVSSPNITDDRSTLFVFIRPVILRDDEFADLKFLSERDIKLAGLPSGMPASKPMPIR
ncbi:MAG TPA: secretin N-terminal domain-containing protein [Tepidisphaeraceae bacterium]|nr:secretin N-terminal domain-containing protein [Tepidisphaeraceae bacterium]